MGNDLSEIRNRKSKKLKSFNDIKYDTANLNEIFKNEDFIRELGCKLSINVKGSAIIYRLKKEVKFELEIRKKDRVEVLTLKLPEFNYLYNHVVSFSISCLNLEAKNFSPGDDIKNEEMKENNLSNQDGFKPTITATPIQENENDLCVICFEKKIQNILPCSHGFCEGCCAAWYDKKSKTDCPLCRTDLAGSWQERSFHVVNSGDKDNAERKEIVKFINSKTLIIKIC